MPGAGDCDDCTWARRVPNRRGAVFVLCRRSDDDPAFEKYPRLPVLRCPGYEKAES